MAAPVIPTTMRAALVLDERPQLEIVTIPVPRPRAGEALVRVEACGVCHTDLHVLKGEVAFPRPAVLGHEISGEVVLLGPDSEGSHVNVGDRVVGAFIMPCTECAACRRGRDDLCVQFFAQNRLRGTLYDGESRLQMPDGSFLAMYSMAGMAEYAVVPLSALATLPAGLDARDASVLGCAGMTAYGAVHRAGRVEAGHSVAIIGAGGIGSSIIRVLGGIDTARVIAVDVADDKLDSAIQLGATHTIDATAVDPVEAVREITDGGADIVFEALGHPATFEQGLGMLADGGRLVAIGIAAGASAAQVPITPLVRRAQEIVGSFGARTREDLPAVVDLESRGELGMTGLISRRYDLADADEAFRALDRREITGRAIVTMNGEDSR